MSLNDCHGQVDVPTQQSYLWYASSPGDVDPQVCNIYAGLVVIMTGFSDMIVILSLLQASGAYIFRPSGPPKIVARSVSLLFPLSLVLAKCPTTHQ